MSSAASGGAVLTVLLVALGADLGAGFLDFAFAKIVFGSACLGTRRAGHRVGCVELYDDAAVVAHADALALRAKSRTGYTHQWRTADLAALCMASVDSALEAREAQLRGYRTFRVTELEEGRMRGEALCPASEEAGKRVTCETCPIGCGRGAT